MTRNTPAQTRGTTWFMKLAGASREVLRGTPTVLVKDAQLGNELVRYLAVTRDPDNPSPRARNGELGIGEAITIASRVSETVNLDKDRTKRPIIALVDAPSQVYGTCEEENGIFLTFAAAVEAYVAARMSGHPIIALVVGGAFSGAFLAHGYQAHCILSIDAPGVSVHAMGQESAARVMKMSRHDFDEICRKSLPMSYDLRDYTRLGMLHRLLTGIEADSPDSSDVDAVKSALIDAICVARSRGPYLSYRLNSESAHLARSASLRVIEMLNRQWDEARKRLNG